MQHIDIVVVGRIKEKYITAGINEYLKRLKSYARVRILEGPELKVPEKDVPGRVREILQAEGQGLQRLISQGAYIIALDREGVMLSSKELADKIAALSLQGRSHLAFIIGGTLGLSPEILEQADFRLSFSRFTFPHQLMRLILLEQLFRSFRIQRGEPYHK